MHLSHIFYRCMFILNQAKIMRSLYIQVIHVKQKLRIQIFFKLSALYDVT